MYLFVATRHLKPPNRKKHEEDIEKLNLMLREKDDELVSFIGLFLNLNEMYCCMMAKIEPGIFQGAVGYMEYGR